MRISKPYTTGLVLLLAVVLQAATDLNLPGHETGAQPANAVFSAANLALSDGHYEEAINGYTCLLTQGYDSAALWFNQGTARRFMGQSERATVDLYRALKRAPWNQTIRHALDAHLLVIGTGPLRIPAPIRVAYRLKHPHWRLTAAIIFASLWLPLIIKGTFRDRTVSLSAAAALALGLTIATTDILAARHPRWPYAVVLASHPAKFWPDDSSRSLFELRAGALIESMQQHQDWTRVRDSYGRIGWIPVNILDQP